MRLCLDLFIFIILGGEYMMGSSLNPKLKKLKKLTSCPNWDKVIKVISIFAMLLMLASAMIFAVTSYRHRFQSDAATAAIIALEQCKTGSLFVHGWYYTQDFWPMFVFNGVVLLQPILHNAFLASQIPVMLQTLCVFLLTIHLLKKTSDSNLIYLLTAFLFSGVSYFWSEFYFGQGQYGNVVFWVLLGIVLLLDYISEKNKKKSAILFVILFVVNFYINTTSVRYIPFFSATAVGTLFVLFFIYKDAPERKRYVIAGVNLIVSSALGITVFKWLTTQYQFIPGTTGSSIISYQDALTTRIPLLFHGFFTLICDGAEGVSFASINGILFAYRFCICLSIFSLPIFAVAQYIKNFHSNNHFEKSFIAIFSLALTAITVFSLIFTKSADGYVATARYLMLAAYVSLLTIPLLLSKYKLDWKATACILVILLPILVYNTYTLNSKMFDAKSDKEELADYLLDNNLSVGYATYWNADSLSVMSNYQVMVYHINQTQMTQFLYLSSIDDYQSTEKLNFLLLNNSEIEAFDFSTLNKYMGDPIKTLEFSDYKIYIYDKPFSQYMPGWS